MSQINTELRKNYLDIDQKMFLDSHFGAYFRSLLSNYTDIFA
jgi:hypothetical protein